MFDKLVTAGIAGAVALTGYVGGFFGGEEPAIATGQIYHYVRSNSDGSGAENVYVYRADANRIEVYTSAERCGEASFATAWVDSETGRASMVTNGRLMPDARHENFSTLHFDGNRGRLSAEAALADGMANAWVSVDEPVYHLYDFDLASLSVQTMALADPRAGFSFGLPVVRADGDADGLLEHLGRVEARFISEEDYRGTAALRFEVSGPALGEDGGPLWLDAESGHVLGASWATPNRAGMEDFALRLVEVDTGGERAWTALLTSHFEGCAIA